MAPSGSAIFRSLLVGIAGVLVSSVATAQTPTDPPYPGQAVRLVVPFSAGSVTDLLARIIGEKLGERWGQQLIVENRPGIPGTASVAKSAPDGYTLMLTSNGHTVAAVLNKNLPFDPVRDFSGVTQVASVPLVLIVPPDSSATTLRELVALAKDRPGALNFASSGLASTAYISGELFKQTAKIDIVHVPYKGAPESLTGIMRADSHMFFAGINIALDLIQSGKVRPLAVAASKRIATLPAVPTFAEAGMPEFEYDAWFGVMAPTNTPIAIRTKVGQDVAAVLRTAEVQRRLESQGVVTVVNAPQEFDALIRSDTERFGRMLRDAGVAAN
jgi:tripartite-type tricarboxylate transporter receptor subunit TctC